MVTGVPRTWQVLETAAPGCDGKPSPSFSLQLAGVRAPVVTRYAIKYDDPDAPCVQLTVAGATRPGRSGESLSRPRASRSATRTPRPFRSGPTPSTVPAVFGLTEGEALKMLEGAGVGNLVTEAAPGCLPWARAGHRTGPGAPLDPDEQVR